MPKFDYSYLTIPKDEETLAHALLQIKKEQVRWTPERKTIMRNKLIQTWNAKQTNPLMIYHVPCKGQEMPKEGNRHDNQE